MERGAALSTVALGVLILAVGFGAGLVVGRLCQLRALELLAFFQCFGGCSGYYPPESLLQNSSAGRESGYYGD